MKYHVVKRIHKPAWNSKKYRSWDEETTDIYWNVIFKPILVAIAITSAVMYIIWRIL